jgi:hypothetical protein
MMEILAEEFMAAGHQVNVVTQVASEAERDHDYEIVRLPSLKSCVQLLRSSDVCLSANVSLRGLGLIAISGTPLVISHQGTYGCLGRFSIVPELKGCNSIYREYLLQPSRAGVHPGAIDCNPQYLSQRDF